MDLTVGTEAALALGTVLVSVGASWGVLTARQNADEKKNDRDLAVSDNRFKTVESEIGSLREWRDNHERDVADRRTQYEARMGEMAGNFRVIQAQLKNMENLLSEKNDWLKSLRDKVDKIIRGQV